MKYEPKPLVEEHYHIQELIDRQSKRTEDRNYHRERGKEIEERNDLIKDAKLVVLTDFWCEVCSKDFKSVAIKQIETDWSCSTQKIAFYNTKHWCGSWCQRLITDKNRDSYWFKSKAVAKDRGISYADTIQPYQTGFNLLYGKK